MTNLRERDLASETAPQKSIELWTYDELINWACLSVIQTGVVNPDAVKSAVWQIVDVSTRWKSGQP